jgi:hypothetical protein
MSAHPCDFEGRGGPCWGLVACVDHYGSSMFDPPAYGCSAHAATLSCHVYGREDGTFAELIDGPDGEDVLGPDVTPHP